MPILHSHADLLRTGICAAIKASKLGTLNARSDFTWETFSLFLWTGIEIILLITRRGKMALDCARDCADIKNVQPA